MMRLQLIGCVPEDSGSWTYWHCFLAMLLAKNVLMSWASKGKGASSMLLESSFWAIIFDIVFYCLSCNLTRWMDPCMDVWYGWHVDALVFPVCGSYFSPLRTIVGLYSIRFLSTFSSWESLWFVSHSLCKHWYTSNHLSTALSTTQDPKAWNGSCYMFVTMGKFTVSFIFTAVKSKIMSWCWYKHTTHHHNVPKLVMILMYTTQGWWRTGATQWMRLSNNIHMDSLVDYSFHHFLFSMVFASSCAREAKFSAPFWSSAVCWLILCKTKRHVLHIALNKGCKQ